jgi:hypothetical protein
LVNIALASVIYGKKILKAGEKKRQKVKEKEIKIKRLFM